MSNFITFFKKPIVWVYISIIYIWLLSISILIASIGPTLLVAKIADNDHSISLADLKMAFLTIVQELNYDYNYVLYALIFNLVIYPSVVMIGFFVLRRNMWARNAMIALIVILMLYPIVFNLLFLDLTFKIVYTIGNFNTLIYLGMIILFTRKNTKVIFLKDNA